MYEYCSDLWVKNVQERKLKLKKTSRSYISLNEYENLSRICFIKS
jgi:hypothetical protein